MTAFQILECIVPRVLQSSWNEVLGEEAIRVRLLYLRGIRQVDSRFV